MHYHSYLLNSTEEGQPAREWKRLAQKEQRTHEKTQYAMLFVIFNTLLNCGGITKTNP